MTFQYKHVLMIGGTAGIGRAMTACLVNARAKVTVVGRRQERLDELVKEHGEQKVRGVAFDIGDLDKITEFATK